jgi:hypothetical protein
VKRKAIEKANTNIITESKYDSEEKEELLAWLRNII